jgi:LysM repeat protein
VTYGARKIFLLDVLPVVILFVVPLCAHAGLLSTIAGLFGEQTAAQEKVVAGQGADDIELLRAATNHDPNPAKGGGDILIEGDALVADFGPLGGEDAVKAKETNGEISVYIVREGDTLSQIAEMFGVTRNTILWANDIKKETGIQPGDELIILPITGVRHVVKKGDTMKSIATKYHGDVADILAYNQLDSATDIQVGSTIVIPGGEVEAPKEVPKKTGTGVALGGGTSVTRSGSYTNPVPGAVRTQGIHGYNSVDLGAPAGTPIKAAAAGEVIVSKASGWNGGYGSYIVIKHADGTQTLYAHLSSNSVAAGGRVAQGQVIGAVGNTGKSTGNHLHFEVRGARNPF